MEIPAAGHDYGDPVWTWSDDSTLAIVTLTCKNDHEHTVTVVGKVTEISIEDASCETDGKKTLSAKAELGGKEYNDIKEIVIPATGHDWGDPVYTWSDDYKTVTAERICKNDADHKETETAEAACEVTKGATCTEAGTGVWTSAAFENSAFEVQTKEVEIPATSHDWGDPVYTWSDDYKTVTAERICKNDADHKETETAEAACEVTKGATCTEAGTGVWTSAAFENSAFEVQTKEVEIPATGHDWDEGKVIKEPTNKEEGKMLYTCRRCGETRTEVIPKLDYIPVESVILEPSAYEMTTSKTTTVKPYTITKASTLQLTAKIMPENASEKNVIWTSSKPSVAKVDENGLVTALTYGSTTITVTTEDGAKTAVCEIQTKYNDVCGSPEKDSPNYEYWYTPVYWAADSEITRGFDNTYFGPEENCTREQMITFLYRTAGSPAVSGTVPFSDVKKGSYYYNAVLWGYQNGITKGYSSGVHKGKFGVGLNVTREETVTFIYRMAGKPSYKTSKSFSDLNKSQYYYDAILWAAQNKITNGYSDGTFGVGKSVRRKDIVTFLYRYYNL